MKHGMLWGSMRFIMGIHVCTTCLCVRALCRTRDTKIILSETFTLNSMERRNDPVHVLQFVCVLYLLGAVLGSMYLLLLVLILHL